MQPGCTAGYGQAEGTATMAVNRMVARRSHSSTVPPHLKVLWLAVPSLGNMRGEPFQKEFADQIRHSIRARSGQTIEDD